jgi:hypothetical protein
MEEGRSGIEKGCVRRALYSSSFMSEVRIRDSRPVPFDQPLVPRLLLSPSPSCLGSQDTSPAAPQTGTRSMADMGKGKADKE